MKIGGQPLQRSFLSYEIIHPIHFYKAPRGRSNASRVKHFETEKAIKKVQLSVDKKMGSENKETWYPTSALSDKQKKLCRCLLRQRATELERYGKVVTQSPYGICISGVARNKPETRRKLQQTAVSGACTRNLLVVKLPTRYLYAYGHLRQNTKKGQHYFKSLPSPSTFFKDPERYRNQLLQSIAQYKSAEEKKKSKSTIKPKRKSTTQKKTKKKTTKKKKKSSTTKKKSRRDE